MREEKNKKLGLKKPDIPLTPAEEQKKLVATMGNFYAIVGDAALNLSIATNQIANILEHILVEISDIKDNFNHMGIKEGWISEIEIDEREKEENPDEPTRN